MFPVGGVVVAHSLCNVAALNGLRGRVAGYGVNKADRVKVDFGAPHGKALVRAVNLAMAPGGERAGGSGRSSDKSDDSGSGGATASRRERGGEERASRRERGGEESDDSSRPLEIGADSRGYSSDKSDGSGSGGESGEGSDASSKPLPIRMGSVGRSSDKSDDSGSDD
eukprot:gene7960-9159_t